MRKLLFAGLTVAVVFDFNPARAQQAQSSSATPTAATASSTAPTAEDLAALSDARIAAIKIGLNIKPDQEKNWTTFETAIRDISKQRDARLRQMVTERAAAAQKVPDPIDAMRRRAAAMSDVATDLKKLADAADPLYKSLDDVQKRRMIVLIAAGGRRR